ncbi:MAG: glycosyltransferase [Candidatus Hydrogenedentes bacterium]|nr:glycosyltransferase [Candidatus Hydrogenedentota bacterium]
MSIMTARHSTVIQATRELLDSVPPGSRECMIVGPCAPPDLCGLMEPAVSKLGPFGTVCVIVSQEGEWCGIPEQLAVLWSELGLVSVGVLARSGNGRSETAVALVRSTYDPIAHARALEQQGMPNRALSALDSIESLVNLSVEQTGLIAGEKLRILHAMTIRENARDLAYTYFAHARKQFQLAVHPFPQMHLYYRQFAELWHHLGNDAMAMRLLKSVCHVAPNEESLVLMTRLKPSDAPQPESESSPIWTGKKRPPRILVITHDASDYGMDCLYDGLCIVLGKDNVVEYPWKPTLHGHAREEALNYPCVFEYPGEPLEPAAIEQQLRHGRFDLILFADTVQMSSEETVRRFLDAAPDVPVVVYDPWDDCQPFQHVVLEYLGRPSVAAYFKREMVAGFDYGPNSFPLPFGYPDRLVPKDIDVPRTHDLFWAGKRIFGTRSLYLDYLQSKGYDVNRHYSQEDYRKAIATARVGLSFFGFGYDTVRYWELPAHGVMLLAERPPIRIPHNFVHGESALFFDDLLELEERLAYMSSHQDECMEIARAGAAIFREHHTASARARQLLGRIESLATW